MDGQGVANIETRLGRVATMPGWTGRRALRLELEIKALPTSGRDRPMARNGYSATWRSMAFGWALAASSVSGRSWAYAASKRGGSRRPLSPGTGCRSRRTSWASFKVYRPNAVWVTDITYVPTDEGWLYLAGHKGPVYRRDRGLCLGEVCPKPSPFGTPHLGMLSRL